MPLGKERPLRYIRTRRPRGLLRIHLREPQGEGADDSGREEVSLAAAIHCLASGLERLGRRRLCVEEIDGERARLSPLADLFTSAGFRAGYRGLELERSAPDSGAEGMRG